MRKLLAINTSYKLQHANGISSDINMLDSSQTADPTA